jgi:hypothetical protein
MIITYAHDLRQYPVDIPTGRYVHDGLLSANYSSSHGTLSASAVGCLGLLGGTRFSGCSLSSPYILVCVSRSDQTEHTLTSSLRSSIPDLPSDPSLFRFIHDVLVLTAFYITTFILHERQMRSITPFVICEEHARCSSVALYIVPSSATFIHQPSSHSLSRSKRTSAFASCSQIVQKRIL